MFGSGETNPLVITFATPVNDFSILVANNDAAGNYTVTDNLGDSVKKSLAANGIGAANFALAGNGISTVEITSFNANDWNFAIDNVTFAAATTAPEPLSLRLFAAGAVGLLLIRPARAIVGYVSKF